MERIIEMEKYTKRLSIIVPVYNVEKYLERCMMSLLEQDVPHDEYEIILVNDGSTDKSLEVANRLKEKFSNISVYTQENKGQAAARNVGIKVAKGKYILFVDSDDFVETCVFNVMLNKMETGRLDILITLSKSMKEDGTFDNIYIPPFPKMEVFTGDYVLTKGYRPAAVWAKLFRKDFITKHIDGFHEGIIHEDVLFCMKLFTYAERIAFLDVVSYVYFYNPQSTDRFMDSRKIIYSINSEIEIANEYKCFANSPHLSERTSQIFIQLANGLTLNTIYSIFRKYKIFDIHVREQFVSKMEEMELIPVQGSINSTRGKFLNLFLKMPWFIRLVFRIQSVLYQRIKMLNNK